MMNIVIPMAGRGKRFADVGYKDPKPFIDVLGRPMISRVIENLTTDDIDVSYTFICLKSFIDEYGDRFNGLLNGLNFNIVTVDQVTSVPAATVLLAKEKINNNDELIIANCDQLVLDLCFMHGSIEHYRRRAAHGGILCFLNDNPKWSYVRMNGDKVIEVVEKQVVSNLATVGLYYYAKGSYFVSAAESMIEHNIRVNGEFYVAPAYNLMLVSGMKIVPYIVNEVAGLGTPEDLEKFINESTQN